MRDFRRHLKCAVILLNVSAVPFTVCWLRVASHLTTWPYPVYVSELSSSQLSDVLSLIFFFLCLSILPKAVHSRMEVKRSLVLVTCLYLFNFLFLTLVMDSASGTISWMKVSNIASFVIQSIEYTVENLFKKQKEKKNTTNLKDISQIHTLHTRETMWKIFYFGFVRRRNRDISKEMYFTRT